MHKIKVFAFLLIFCAAVTGVAGCRGAGDTATAALLSAVRAPFAMYVTAQLPAGAAVDLRYIHTEAQDSIEILNGGGAGCMLLCDAQGIHAVSGSLTVPYTAPDGIASLFSLFAYDENGVTAADGSVSVIRQNGGVIRGERGTPTAGETARGISFSVISFEAGKAENGAS